MATATLSRDVDVPQRSNLRDAPAHASSSHMEEDETMKHSNGYIASPLRSSQRIGSVISEEQLPDVPKDEPTTNGRPSGVRFDATSFPFAAQPGTSGPAPTTNDMVGSTWKSDSMSSHGQAKKKTSSGAATPPGRRSVQFARDTTSDEPTTLGRTTTWEETPQDGAETVVKDRQGSFLGKLKALATSSSASHTRSSALNSPATPTAATPNAAMSPQSERSESTYPVEPSEAADADVEDESEDFESQSDAPRQKTRRKSRRPVPSSSESVPSTPRISRLEHRFASFIRDQTASNDGKSSPSRPTNVLSRRNTASDAGESGRAGVSEDEGRDRVRNAWRRGIDGARGLTYSGRTRNDADSPDARRPSHIRRLTTMGASNVDGASGSPFRMRERADRYTGNSAQRWRQVKAGIKMIGQRRREERMRVDHQKSAQLMAELFAGAPAALVLASMFQRDENNHRKIPVLLDQLKIRIPDSQIRKESGDRHLIFKIELEYGNGPARMVWSINRTFKDFVSLHAKYQSSSAADKVRHLRSDNKNKAKMPRFPKSAFPYARQIRGLYDILLDEGDDDEEVPPTPGGPRALEGVMGSPFPITPGPAMTPLVPGGGPVPMADLIAAATNGEEPATPHERKSSIGFPRKIRRTSTAEMAPPETDPETMTERQKELYFRRCRRKLETYLQQMIRWLMFRADSTRLCKFLEISALAIRLSAEGGFSGKQGLLTIASRQNRELRHKSFKPQALVERHKRRWFLVRHSYIVCVDGPESLNPYDVFLVDSDFRTEKLKKILSEQKSTGDKAKAVAEKAVEAPKNHTKHLLLRLYNSERKLKLVAGSEKLYQQFKDSIDLMAEASVWSKKQRFDSYAPVRSNVWCRWLVDGRDHMWQVSRAIDNAKDFVYIHDWWLSPELYMRRPAAISQKWRLDRLLQRKAEEGVKIFVIVYRNIESAIPIDSEYTKWSLLDLHENICIQRSPNQFRQNQFFWAHHEKLVVVDNMMAFVGGIDLCFGRWDDPCHTLTDDKLTGFEIDHDGPRDSEHCQMWPGKDYSNPRVQDFYALDRPYEEMYDRTKVPRMPWHDIAMQIVGQPARDLGRHFVQRWNYILRSRIPSRPTPVLVPPPEYEQPELDRLGMTGTCQVQLLRSCANWSIGTNKVEHSIMNAYVHLIEHSQHFVYMENQFFITSCTVEGTPIYNKIGDALVDRIIQAHENDEMWRACIVIPLMPGFQNSVDSQDGTSLRLILQCQFRSICRGESSIFGRLRARGIDPEEYIQFYSLRKWGKIGPRQCLTTEQLYIHAKCMVVDDRSVIIGSANINERSMLGSRDSEVAAIVTDMKMIPSFMGGEPFEVGEFAHTLRKRLMREHLGIDVDAVYRHEQAVKEREAQDAEMAQIYREQNPDPGDYFSNPQGSRSKDPVPVQRNLEARSAESASNGLDGTTRVGSSTSVDELPEPPDRNVKKGSADLQHDLDVEGFGVDNMRALGGAADVGPLDSFVDTHGREVLSKFDSPDIRRLKSMEDEERRRSQSEERGEEKAVTPPYPTERMGTYNLGLAPRSQLPELPVLDDTDIGGPALTRGTSAISTKGLPPLAHTLRRPEVHGDCMTDPIISTFYDNIWHQVADNNTKIYRQVFRCMPDSEVTDWRAYEKFNEYNERFMQSQGLGMSKPPQPKEAPDKSGPPGSAGTESASIASLAEKATEGRARSKSVLSNFMNKLRPGSAASSEPTHTEEMNEKSEAQDTGKRAPESPNSGASSDPTVVPSPQPGPVDEKEAQMLADKIEHTDYATVDQEKQALKEEDGVAPRKTTIQYDEKVNSAPETTATQAIPSSAPHTSGSQRRRRRGTTKSSARTVPEEVLGTDEAEAMLKLVQGNLVLWPYDWLEKEERGGNWLYNIDQLAPLEIYD